MRLEVTPVNRIFPLPSSENLLGKDAEAKKRPAGFYAQSLNFSDLIFRSFRRAHQINLPSGDLREGD